MNTNKPIKTDKKIFDIHDRIFDFVVKVLKFIEALPRTESNKIIIYQISRSVTSMGANDQEADGALTRKEFLHRYSIVRKEGKETNYWLKLICAVNSNKKKKADQLREEGEEIVAIVSKIISNTTKTGVEKKK